MRRSPLLTWRADPVTVAAVLGHEDPNVRLKVYAHAFDRRRIDEAVRQALAG
jgi:integrase